MARALDHDKANAQIRGERQIERDQRHEARWKPRNRQARREEYLAALNPLPVTIDGAPTVPLAVRVSRLRAVIEAHSAVCGVDWQDTACVVTFHDADLFPMRVTYRCDTSKVLALETLLRDINQVRSVPLMF